MKKVLLAALVAFLLIGCAMQQINQWSAENRSLAENGKIKWSQYYSNLYQKILSLHIPNKGATLENINNMILISQNYEAGTITKEQFEYSQRSAEAQLQKLSDNDSAIKRAAIAEGMRNFGNSIKSATPKTTSCQAFGNQMNCTSY